MRWHHISRASWQVESWYSGVVRACTCFWLLKQLCGKHTVHAPETIDVWPRIVQQRGLKIKQTSCLKRMSNAMQSLHILYRYGYVLRVFSYHTTSTFLQVFMHSIVCPLSVVTVVSSTNSCGPTCKAWRDNHKVLMFKTASPEMTECARL
jgi:hypothetical protein